MSTPATNRHMVVHVPQLHPRSHVGITLHPVDDSSGNLLPPLGSHEQEPNVEIDTTRPHPARIYDFLLGGKDHYQADLDAGKKILEVSPAARAEALANRDFLHRAVAYAAGQGISQFLDIGTGIPTMGPTHQTAQRV